MNIVVLNIIKKMYSVGSWVETQLTEDGLYWTDGKEKIGAVDEKLINVNPQTVKGVIIKANDKETTIQLRNTFYIDSPKQEVENGSWLTVTKDNASVIFSNPDGEVGCIKDDATLLKQMKVRKKLKAIVVRTEKGRLLVEIIRWADLHRRSGYSLLSSTIRVPDMVEKTEYVGALTDRGVMYGAVGYYKQMKKIKKQPIIGFEAYVESIAGYKHQQQLVLYAMNEKGFKNLVKLTTESYTNMQNEIPYLSYEMLSNYAEGVLVTSAYASGEIGQALKNGDFNQAKKVAEVLIELYGKENVYLEIQRHGLEEEEQLNPRMLKLGATLDLKVIGTTESHMTNEDDFHAHEVLLALKEKTTLDDETRFRYEGECYQLLNADDMDYLFKDIPEVLDNTLEIAEKCNVEIELSKIYLPHFKIPVLFKDESAYFEHLCWKGFKERFKGTDKEHNPEYLERLQFEIDTINKMGFPGYFLIVWDFVDFAKRNDILVGPGRGSACGSLVAYTLSITQVDPITYGLLFERFLNVDRISMPDIDLDFDDMRREEVIDYVKEKYGAEAVSRIITFGTLSARSVVRDVTRVTNNSYSLGDRIAKAIPAVPKMTLKKAMKESPEFKKMYTDEPIVKEIIDIAMELEGLPRNISIHACGLIIAPSAVSDYLPQILIEDDNTGAFEPTTQITMGECEEMGLLKMDFLGLRTMGVVSRALTDINAKRSSNGEESIDFLNIPTDDVAVYNFISKGNTQGVFQLESGGMTSFMQELFQDAHKYMKLSEDERRRIGRQLYERTIAGISLYRPGPIDEIPNYINNMLNPDYIVYELEKLKPILHTTYGIIVYQEQVMFIVRELAGFSKGDSDTIRKAMGKKISYLLDEYEQYFIYGSEKMKIAGCLANGISEETARSIWNKMKKFGEYAFNKSHAGGYAEIAVRTGWLALYYPTEYFTATLNSFISKSDRIKMYLAVCKKKGIEILPPDVNKSQQMFSVDGEAIRFGLMGIKNMGKISEQIIEERNLRGDFMQFQDFAERMALHFKVNKKILQALVYSGAVDNFEGTRKAKLSVLEDILASASLDSKAHKSGQLDLFGFDEEFAKIKHIPIPDVEEYDSRFKLEKEKEYAGFYITEHPMDMYMDYFASEGVYEIGFLTLGTDNGEEDVEDYGKASMDGETVKIAGIIQDLKIFYTKKDNKPLYVFNVEDKSGDIKGVIFSEQIEMHQDKLVEGKIVLIQGQIKQDDFGSQIIVQHMYDIESIAKKEKPKALWIKIHSQEQKAWIEKVAKKHPGELPVMLYYEEKAYRLNGLPIQFTFEVFAKFQEMFGENVKVTYHQ